MAEKGSKLRLNITVPNIEPIHATYDTDNDAWVLKFDLYESSIFRSVAFNHLKVIREEHEEIHEGNHFFIQDAVDLSINAVYDVQFFTADVPFWKNFTFNLAPESEMEWFIYEGATVITPGTLFTANNNNRNAGGSSSATIRGIQNSSVANANADTAVAGAYQLAHGIIGSGKNGGVLIRENEIILRQNTMYCFRAIASVAGYVSFNLEWYEHQNE